MAVERVAAGEGRRLGLPGRTSVELFGRSTGSASTVRRVVIPATTEAQRSFHVHNGVEEIIHILRGSGTLRTPSGAVAVASGDTIRIPSGVPHFTVPATEEIELLSFFPHGDIAAVTTEWERTS